jgi:hypothetical protein
LYLNAFKSGDDVIIIGSSIAYLALGIVATVWVAQALHRQGRVFLIESFAGPSAAPQQGVRP